MENPKKFDSPDTERAKSNALGPVDQFVVLEHGDVYDVIVHPFVQGATARIYHSNGAIRADGSCGQHPGTYVVPMDEENNPEFYALKIDSSERGREVVSVRWENHRRAMREGIEKAVRENKKIPVQMMNSEVATSILSENLAKRTLDPEEPLREARETTKYLLEKSDLLPVGQRSGKDAPDVAIQINITEGLFTRNFEDDED